MKKRWIWCAFTAALIGILVLLCERSAAENDLDGRDIIMEITDNPDGALQSPEMSEVPTKLQKSISEHSSIRSIVVAIIDTGLDYAKFGYKDRVIDIERVCADGGQQTSLTDENGHGTVMAEIIAKNSGERVKLLPIKVADKEGRATVAEVCGAIALAQECGADVINLSMNTLNSKNSALLDAAIDDAVANHVAVIVSAGNKGVDVKDISPANNESATVISAVDRNGIFAAYSNYGRTVDYSAPGFFGEESGTSYAAACYSGVLAEVLSKGLDASFIDDCLGYEAGSAVDPYYGKGVVALYMPERNLLDEFFGEGWEEQDQESPILKMNDFHFMADARISEYVARSDLADVGYYLSNLSTGERKELLARDTLLTKKVCFCEGSFSGGELADGDDITLTTAEEVFYYEKCIGEYEREAAFLQTSATKYLHKTGCFKLSFVDTTGSGYSTTYEICARVCVEGASLTGSGPETGKPVDRNIFELGNKTNAICVWSSVSSGCSDTMRLKWVNEGGYASFLSDDTGAGGRIFSPNIYVDCPAYMLMYTATMTHANGGGNCTGRANFFAYTASNANASDYANNRGYFYLRKYGMSTAVSVQKVRPQINTSHMNLSDTSRNQTSATTICTMYIYLNQPSVALTVNPNGEKWGGKTQSSTLSVVNTQSYELGKTTVTNYRATFYGGGDVLDPVGDSSITTDKAFSHWSLSHSAGGSGQIGSVLSSMNGTTFTAGRVEYDKGDMRAATVGEKVTAAAVFSGSTTITFPEAPQRRGYSFAGWYTGERAGTGTLACARENAGRATVTLTADSVYHAEWIRNQYTVRFYSEDTLLTEKAYPYRSDVDLSVSTPRSDGSGIYYEQPLGGSDMLRLEKNEYVFVGWSLAKGGAVISSVNIPADHGTCLYAVWSRPTSGMKQVAVTLQSGENRSCGFLVSEGPAAINLTLGLRALLYQSVLPLQVMADGIAVTDDGTSYAEDGAGNKTPLASENIAVLLPERYTFIYKYYTYNPKTAQWDYLENKDTWETADIFPEETYCYAFRETCFSECPYGYGFHHASYGGEDVALPYEVEVVAQEGDAHTVRTMEVFFYPISCKLTFDANGGIFLTDGLGDAFAASENPGIVEKTVLFGSSVGSFPGVYKNEFYGCTGFYDGRENGSPVDMNDVVTSDMVLYAGWQAKEGTVRYDAGTNQGTVGGEKSMDTLVVYEAEIPYGEYVAKREQYEFLGWAQEAQSMPQGEEPAVLQPREEPLRLLEQGITLYAQFRRTLWIMFHQWDCVECGMQPDGRLPVLYNHEESLYIVTPLVQTYGGWEICGWTTDDTLAEGYEAGEQTQILVEDDMDYYAVYRRQVTLSYDTGIVTKDYEGDDETGFAEADTEPAYRSTGGCDDCLAEFVIREGPKRSYHTFLYWQGSDGERYEPGDWYASVEDLQLTAVWAPDSATVIYDAGTNGGTIFGEGEVRAEIPFGNEIPADALTYPAKKEGYEFAGWNTDPDASDGLWMNPDMDGKTMDDGVVTLYAVFKRTITASFYQQGEENPWTVCAVLYNNAEKAVVHAPVLVEYSGWEALGWTTQKEAGTMVELRSDTDFNLYDDMDFYALFQKSVYLTYETGVSGMDIQPEEGITYHNSVSSSAEQDIPAYFVVAPAPEAAGRSFLIWEDENLDGYAPEEVVVLYEDKHLAAAWDEYPKLQALDRYFTLEEATDGAGRYINETVLLDEAYVKASDREDEDRALIVSILDFDAAEYRALTGSAEFRITFSVTDSYGNRTTTTATVHVTDTGVKENPIVKETRFLTQKYYRRGDSYLEKEFGGLSGTSLWRMDSDLAEYLQNAMDHAKDPDRQPRFSHTFTMSEIKEIQAMLYGDGGFGKYGPEELFSDFIRTYIKKDPV